MNHALYLVKTSTKWKQIYLLYIYIYVCMYVISYFEKNYIPSIMKA